MNRSIKVRGLSKLGTWIIGVTLVLDDDVNISSATKAWIIPQAAGGMPVQWDKIEVDIKTIGKCSGLIDKTKREIFEGDILRCEGWKATGPFPTALLAFHLTKDHDDTIDVVVFEKGTFGAHITKPTTGFIPIWEYAQFSEVTGNIHENPELLNTTV